MSYNDRCGEAAAILEHGGTLPSEARLALIEWCENGKEGWNSPPRDLVYAIREHPDNAHLLAQTSDGEWTGPGGPEAADVA